MIHGVQYKYLCTVWYQLKYSTMYVSGVRYTYVIFRVRHMHQNSDFYSLLLSIPRTSLQHCTKWSLHNNLSNMYQQCSRSSQTHTSNSLDGIRACQVASSQTKSCHCNPLKCWQPARHCSKTKGLSSQPWESCHHCCCLCPPTQYRRYCTSDTIPYNELNTLIRAASTSADTRGSHMRGIHPAIVAEWEHVFIQKVTAYTQYAEPPWDVHTFSTLSGNNFVDFVLRTRIHEVPE